MKLEVLLDRMLEAVGGREVLESLGSLSMVSDCEYNTMRGSQSADYDIRQGRSHSFLDLGVFQHEEGIVGQQLWRIDENGKVSITEDSDGIAESHSATNVLFNDYLIHRDSYSFELSDEEGHWQLKLLWLAHADKAFATSVLYVNKDSFLVDRVDSTSQGESATTRLLHYESYDGWLFPAMTDFNDALGNRIILRTRQLQRNLPLDDEIFQPRRADVRDFRFPAGEQCVVIPFRYELNHIFVDVRLDDRVYTFAVDTGAGKTVIDAAIAAAQGWESQGELMASGVSGSQAVSLVQLPELSVGEITMNSQTIVAMDFKELRRGLPAMDGILGMDFLNRFIVGLDYVKREMSVYDRKDYRYEGNGAALKLDGIAVELEFDDLRGRFHIDTGASGVSIFSQFLNKNNKHFAKERMPTSARIAGIGNTKLNFYQARGHSLKIADFTLRDFPIEITEIGIGAFAHDDLAGNIGNLIWKRFLCLFDFSANMLYLEANSNYDEAFKTQRAGLGVEIRDGEFRISWVLTHSPAAQAGFSVGEVVQKINDRDSNELTIDSIVKLLRQPVDTVLNFALRGTDDRLIERRLVFGDFVPFYDD